HPSTPFSCSSLLPPPPTSTLFPYTTLFRSLGRARRILVVDAGERDARHAPQQPRVVEPERSGADDADPHRRRAHTSTPRCDPSIDRKSTRLNSSHGSISYAVFCLKKKKHRK